MLMQNAKCFNKRQYYCRRSGKDKRVREIFLQGFTSGLARRYRQHCLTTRAWQAWRSLVEGKWKEKVEKACQKKAQEVCMKLTSDYEARLASVSQYFVTLFFRQFFS